MKIAMPGVVPGRARATTPSSSPTTHEARTAMSVRFGPKRSTSRPQPKAASTATMTRTSDTYRNCPWVSLIPRTAMTLITTISVFTASE